MAANWNDSYYSVTMNSSGYIFYNPEEFLAKSFIFIESSASATITAVKTASVSIAISSNVYTNGKEIARCSINVLTDAQASATTSKIAYASAAVSGDSSCSASTLRITGALASSSADATASATIKKTTNAIISIGPLVYDDSFEYDEPIAYDPQFGAVVVATAGELVPASSSVSGDLNVDTSAIKIALASSSILVPGFTATVAKEIQYPSISIDVSSNVSVSASKVSYASCSLSASASVSVQAIKYAYALSDVSGDSDVVPTSIKIAYAQAALDGIAFNVIVGKEILLAKIIIAATSSLFVNTPVRFGDNIVEDVGLIRTLLLINDKPITEHNRKLSNTINHSTFENSNWSGRRSRYYKTSSGRKMFSLSWSMLPGTRFNSVDSNFARNYISEVGSDPDVHSLKILKMDSDNTTPYSEEDYNVIVRNYSETLVRRDLVGDEYYWDCQLELEEV